MIWYIIRYSIFSIFVLLTLYFVGKKKYEPLLWLYFFTFPFQNCAAFFITSWNPYKVVAIGMALVILFQPIKRQQPTELKRLSFYFFFLLLIGNVVALLMPSYIAGMRGLMRLLIQDVTYILGFIPILYMKWLPSDFGKKALKFYTAAIVTLIIIGFVHYAFLRLGIPFAPIIRDVGTSNDVAATYFGDSIVFRIYGFCGEPKNMAFALVPFILLILSKIFIGKEYNKNNFFMLVCSLFILIHTFSSAAYIEFTIGFIVVFYISLKLMERRLKSLVVVSLFLFSILLVISDLIVSTAEKETQSYKSQSFIESFYERSFGRAQSELEEGRLETRVFNDYIQKKNIFYYLFGYGPGQYSFHSRDLTFSDGYIPIQSGLVLNLVDFGILGYVYFIYLLYFVLKLYLKNRHKRDKESLYFIIVGGAVLIGNMMYSMMGGSILIGMLPFIGIAYWIYNNKIRILL